MLNLKQKIDNYINTLKNILTTKYVIIKGVHIYDRAVFTLIKTKPGSESFTIGDILDNKEFYRSDIYKKIYTFKQLMYWGRMLARSRTKPFYWTVLKQKR